MNEITIRKPDDFHLHLRDGNLLEAVLPHTARYCKRALIMPNLQPPLNTVELAMAYKERILNAALKEGFTFEPLMTLYLTDNTTPEEIVKLKDNGMIAAKLYPAGATTNSDFGVTDIEKIYPVLEKMVELQVPLCVHGEVTDPDVDIFDREAVFIEKVLYPLLTRFQYLRTVFEHVTTAAGCTFVNQMEIKGTITPHHLFLSRNDLLVGGMKPHNYCLPVAKTMHDRKVLVGSAIRSPHFFMGTDSAPHPVHNKHSANCPAGCYNAYSALELYAEVFDQEESMDMLEGFVSQRGAAFYGLEPNQDTITLIKETHKIPGAFRIQIDLKMSMDIIFFMAGHELTWKIKE